MNKFNDTIFNEEVRSALEANPALLQDWRWRIQNLYCIIDKSQKKAVFKPNRAQRAFMDVIDKFPMFIILKSRQLGFTTFISLFFLDKILWGNNVDAAMIAHMLEAAQEIFDKKAKYAAENLPECIRGLVEIDSNTARKLKIIKRNKDKSIAARNLLYVTNSTRSGTYALTHISELAKLYKDSPKKASEVLTGSMSSIALGSKLFIESTAEGAEGLFYETWKKSWNARNSFETDIATVASNPYPLFFNWTYDDEQIDKFYDMYGIIPLEKMEVLDVDWKQFKIDNNLTDKQLSWYYSKWQGMNNDTSKLFQEYPTTAEDAFLNSGQCLFPQRRVVALMDEVIQARVPVPKRYDVPGDYFEANSFGPFYIYETPNPDENYIIGGDTGEGLEKGDNSTLAVIRQSDLEPVAFYYGIISPYEFAEVCDTIGRHYNNALLVVESNNQGYFVNDRLTRDFNYPNIYMQRAYDDISGKYTTKLGWATTAKTRQKALNNFKQAFINTNNWYFKDLLEEMLNFVRSNRGRYEAASGKHDDLVMACACAYGCMSLVKEQSKKTNEELDPHKRFFLGQIDIVEYLSLINPS